jgi:hypothetical protein
MANPIEWFEWIYGKWFVGHPWRGFLAILIVSCTVLGVIIGGLWLRALDNYAQKQAALPKQQTVTASKSASQSVTVQQGTSSQGMQGASSIQPAAMQKKVAKRHKLTQQAALREALPPEDAVAHKRVVPTVLYEPGIISIGDIVERAPRGAITVEGPISKVTGLNDTVRGDDSALIVVQHAGETSFDNNTVVGKGALLKADSYDKTTVTNTKTYADPATYLAELATLTSQTANIFNYGDWVKFLEDYINYRAAGEKEKVEALFDDVRHRLEAHWQKQKLSEADRRENRANLEEVFIELEVGGWEKDTYYRNNVPTFIQLPKS